MLDRVDDRGRQHTDAMLQISANMARLHDSLDEHAAPGDPADAAREDSRGMAKALGDMAGMLARMDEHRR